MPPVRRLHSHYYNTSVANYKIPRRLILITFGTVSLATLGLLVASYRRTISWDLSTHGRNWVSLVAGDGALLYLHSSADSLPLFNGPSSKGRFILSCDQSYLDCAVEHETLTLVRQGLLDSLESVNSQNESVEHSSYRDRLEVQLASFSKTLHKVRTRATVIANQNCKTKSCAGFFLDVGSTPRELVLRIPLAALVLLFGVLPAFGLVGWLRLRARRNHGNLCLTCGYNLTGNISGTCPECGQETSIVSNDVVTLAPVNPR